MRHQVLQQFERAVVGPVQVFNQQHRQRTRRSQGPQVSAHRRKSLVAKAARVQALHGGAVGVVQARKLADELGLALAAFFEPRPQTCDHLAACDLGTVGVGHAALGGQQGAQQAEQAQLAIGLRAQGQHAAVGQAASELAQQPALAQAGVAQQCQCLQVSGLAGPGDGIQQALQLCVTADHRRAQPVQAALDAGQAAV